MNYRQRVSLLFDLCLNFGNPCFKQAMLKMTTTVKKASSPAVYSKENSASLVDATIFYPKISSTSPDSLSQQFHAVRVSEGANKASLESLKDSQTPAADWGTGRIGSAETTADSNDDVEMNSPQSDSPTANETVEQQAASILEAIKTTCPEAAEALQALLTGLMNRIKCMEQQLVDTKAPSTYASAVEKLSGKRKLNSELRLKL
jgi:hypothetical protein